MHVMRFLVHRTPLWFYLSGPFQWFLSFVYFRFWCPGSDLTVCECIRRGECGCDNRSRR